MNKGKKQTLRVVTAMVHQVPSTLTSHRVTDQVKELSDRPSGLLSSSAKTRESNYLPMSE